MSTSILELKFKGQRDYVQAMEIICALLKYLGEDLNTSDIRFVLKKLVTTCLEVSKLTDSNRTCVNVEINSEYGKKTKLYLLQTDKPITVRVPDDVIDSKGIFNETGFIWESDVSALEKFLANLIARTKQWYRRNSIDSVLLVRSLILYLPITYEGAVSAKITVSRQTLDEWTYINQQSDQLLFKFRIHTQLTPGRAP